MNLSHPRQGIGMNILMKHIYLTTTAKVKKKERPRTKEEVFISRIDCAMPAQKLILYHYNFPRFFSGKYGPARHCKIVYFFSQNYVRAT